jgi:uncharacterized repeat protein (TIGR04138 family)
MQKIGFAEALDLIVANDQRYHREAYIFLRDALDFTMKLKKKQKEEASRHVSGQELLEGIRQFALKEYGPMTVTVFDYWGVKKTDDFGSMVFNLIEAGIFGKTDRDKLDDFQNGYDFHPTFVLPFRPERKIKPPVKHLDPAPEKTR